MKGLKKRIMPGVIFLLLVLCGDAASAQLESITVSPESSLDLNFAAPSNSGEPIEPVVDESKWLNYDVALDSTDVAMSISVEISTGDLPDGLQMQLQAGNYSGTTDGHPGSPTGLVTLSPIPQVLINQIGTCDTGSGTAVGHRLTYTLSVVDYSVLKASSSTINILFTITQ